MKAFGYRRMVRLKKSGEQMLKEIPARRITKDELGPSFGSDRKRRLIVALVDGDLISFRPEKASKKRTKMMKAADLYRYVIMCEATAARMAKLRQMKEKKAERLAAARLKRAEKKLFEKSE